MTRTFMGGAHSLPSGGLALVPHLYDLKREGRKTRGAVLFCLSLPTIPFSDEAVNAAFLLLAGVCMFYWNCFIPGDNGRLFLPRAEGSCSGRPASSQQAPHPLRGSMRVLCSDLTFLNLSQPAPHLGLPCQCCGRLCELARN